MCGALPQSNSRHARMHEFIIPAAAQSLSGTYCFPCFVGNADLVSCSDSTSSCLVRMLLSYAAHLLSYVLSSLPFNLVGEEDCLNILVSGRLAHVVESGIRGLLR